jgi:hypothetical protein
MSKEDILRSTATAYSPVLRRLAQLTPLVILLTSAIAPSVRADPPRLPQLSLSSVSGTDAVPIGDAEHERLEQASRDSQTTRPRRGLITSSVLLAGSAGLLASGIALSRLCFSPGQCPNSGGVGAASLGGALMVGSIVGLTISSVRLKRARAGSLRRKKRALP